MSLRDRIDFARKDDRLSPFSRETVEGAIRNLECSESSLDLAFILPPHVALLRNDDCALPKGDEEAQLLQHSVGPPLCSFDYVILLM